MRLVSTMKAKVIAMGTTKSKDGQTTYYRVTILQGMESGMLSVPEDTYKLITPDKEFVFNTEYNSEYKSFRITGIAAENYSAANNAKTPSSTAPPTGASK